MRRTTLTTAVVASLALFPLAGCGGSDSPSAATTGTGAADVVVTTSDQLKFDKDSYTASAGSLTIAVENPGSLPHTLLVEGEDGFKLETTGNDSDSGTITLGAGSYTIFCDVPGHRQAGMESTLVVS